MKKQGAEKLLVNGDIGIRGENIKESQRYSAFILESIGKSGLESFVQPGSHETLLGFQPVIEYFGDKYDNLFTISNPLKLKGQGHDLVFLPGSDFFCGGEYHIGNDAQIPSDTYVQGEKGIRPIDLETYMKVISSGQSDKLELGSIKGIISYNSMNEIKNLVERPEKTIAVCHVPRKFKDIENCVDVAEFGEATQKFQLRDGQIVEKGSVFPIEVAKRLHQEGYAVQVQLKRANRGNKDLANLYDEIGITKGVNGHFHESGHRANNVKGNHLEEGLFSNELFWNSGHLDTGQTGILTVKDNEAKYQNIRLQDYM